MHKIFFLLLFITILISQNCRALGLKVTSSNNAQSNAVKSFIYVRRPQEIIQGIKLNTPKTQLELPQPFIFTLTDELKPNQFLQ